MLAKRIIPCLDVDKGRVVKGVNFVNLIDAGDPVENGKFYDSEGADELVFLDITASSDRRDIILDMVKKVAEEVHIPFTVGGGIRTIDDMQQILGAGADKVSINSSAVENPELISRGAERFGAQAIVVAIDVRRNYAVEPGKKPIALADGRECWYEVVTHGGSRATGRDAVAWAREAEERGAGEILLTSMETDGTKDGFDIPITAAVATAVGIPVVASGGVGTLEHFYEGFAEGKADACLAASVFHYGVFAIREVKEYLAGRGIPVRR